MKYKKSYNNRLYKNKYVILITTNDYLELPVYCFFNVPEASKVLNLSCNCLHSALSRIASGERKGMGFNYNIKLVEMEENEIIEILKEEKRISSWNHGS